MGRGRHLGDVPVEGEGVGHQVCRVGQVDGVGEETAEGVALHLCGL